MRVEILAPGGSKEAIYAGLCSGADAIYTGTSRFSARAFADNPSVEELCCIVDFAHLHGKKVYLTVNTLLSEEELEGSLYEMLAPLYESGLDAVIVQDFGVMNFVREYFPEMDIHASTQMTILTAETANLLKPYGVTRIVPARELSIQEIADMRQQTDLELEVFVHGALCYCYSGQCLMSKVIGGRSGNRGMCAQPCRLPYETDGNRTGYFLSPKDMCTLAHVPRLIEAGVDSFKIEGRMKKPAYTAFTAHLYRTYADACLAGVDLNDREVARDIQRLADIYNRGGFSGGYLFEPSKKNIIYPVKNGHYGVCVGEVKKVNSHTVDYVLTEQTSAQDVLEFRDENGENIYEYTVKEGAEPGDTVSARFKKGSRLRVGQRVFRTKNNKLLHEIEAMIESGKKACKTKIKGTFSGKLGNDAQLVLSYKNFKCCVTGAEIQAATGKPVTAEDIKKRLMKTGESEFEFEQLEVRIDEGCFLPLGSIASLRRKGFEKLTGEILAVTRRSAERFQRKQEEDREPEQSAFYTVIRVSNREQLQGVKSCKKVNANQVRLHLKLDECPPEKWEELAREAEDFSYYISLPAVLREKNREQFLKSWQTYGTCFQKSNTCRGVIVHSLEALPLIAKMDPERKWELLADMGLYNWNRRTEQFYRTLGIQGNLFMAYGRTAVMTTEGCVNRELGGCCKENSEKRKIEIRTPKKDEFVVVNYCEYCYNVIYEKKASRHKPEDLSDIPEIVFTFEGADEVRKVLEEWNFLL